MSQQPMAEPRRHRLTVSDYERMGAVGILAHDVRVELIDGAIIDMAPIGSPHVATVLLLDRVFQDAVKDDALVLVQSPLRLDDYTAPQPDLALLRPRADFYRESLPGPGDVLLIVEVAQSSISFDRDEKIPLYARHGVVEAWLVDVDAARVERYREPRQGRYTLVDSLDLGSTVALAALPETRVHLGGLFA